MMKISATTSMQLLPTHVSDEFLSRNLKIMAKKKDCLKLSHRIIAGVHNAI